MTIAQSKIPVNIEDEMKRSYMDYAMSVIIGRALPDVRDGLKPAHRRVLYGMRLMGLASNRAYRKCAKIVGEVMGNFHPHGDASIYDTLVRLAQDFNMRYPLVDGQGNFGSLDNDPPAAMRYTEARLRALAEELMADLDKETVDFVPNYDESTEEPTVLPAPFPNLLVNGSTGIAVGMATNVPPHNLGEVIDGLLFLIEERNRARAHEGRPLSPEEKNRRLLELIPGPDFPTGGIVVGRSGIYQAYLTGRGALTVRARTSFEESGRGDKMSIVVGEIPYQVNKAKLLEKIADLAREKTIEGIADLRDESDREGLRIVIDLKRGERPELVLNNLLKHTPLQTTFGVNMLAIVGGRPRILPLGEMLELFIDFRREVVRRRTEYELRKAEARAHILEGLRIALDNLDAVIALIRGSRTPGEARGGLMTTFGLTQVQAQAILDMQLQRLTGLERQKIIDELAELLRTIERLRAILASDVLLMDIVSDELRKVKDRFGDARRTEMLVDEGAEFALEDLVPDEDMVISVSATGYIKRTRLDEYRLQRRGGGGASGMQVREEDAVRQLFLASMHSYMLIFSDRGRVYWLKVHRIPEAGRSGKGKHISNLVALEPGEEVASLLSVREWPKTEGEVYVVLGTRKGVVKKTDLMAFSNPRQAGIIAVGVDEDDAVIDVQVSAGKDEILLATRQGMAIRFSEEEVRPMGRTAYGVRGIALRDGDHVVSMAVVHSQDGYILSVTENGYGKRTPLDDYRVQARGGVGIINIQTSDRNGAVVGVLYVSEDDQLMLMTQQGKILRTRVTDTRPIGRNTQGVRLIRIDEADKVVSVARFAEKDDDGGAPADDDLGIMPPAGESEPPAD